MGSPTGSSRSKPSPRATKPPTANPPVRLNGTYSNTLTCSPSLFALSQARPINQTQEKLEPIIRDQGCATHQLNSQLNPPPMLPESSAPRRTAVGSDLCNSEMGGILPQV